MELLKKPQLPFQRFSSDSATSGAAARPQMRHSGRSIELSGRRTCWNFDKLLRAFIGLKIADSSP
jgi:hypothetical protein